MKMYVWDSNVFRNWGTGTIVALGNSVAEARRNATVSGMALLNEKYAYLADDEDMQWYYDELKRDLDGDWHSPANCWIIEGSD